MLISKCQRNNSRNQVAPRPQKIRDRAAVAVAADADAAVPRQPFLQPNNFRKQNRRRHKSNRQSVCARRCRCAPCHRSKNFNLLFQLLAPSSRMVLPLARPSAKQRKSSSRCGSRWNRWRRFWNWLNSPSARNSPTNAKSNRCSAPCEKSSRRVAGMKNSHRQTIDFAATTSIIL